MAFIASSATPPNQPPFPFLTLGPLTRSICLLIWNYYLYGLNHEIVKRHQDDLMKTHSDEMLVFSYFHKVNFTNMSSCLWNGWRGYIRNHTTYFMFLISIFFNISLKRKNASKWSRQHARIQRRLSSNERTHTRGGRTHSVTNWTDTQRGGCTHNITQWTDTHIFFWHTYITHRHRHILRRHAD